MKNFQVCFGGHRVEVQYDSPLAAEVLEFMFRDIQPETDTQLDETFEFTQADDEHWHCYRDGKSIFRSKKVEDTGNHLMGEAVFHLIENNVQHLAMHAGYVSDEQGGIMIPGESGNGKSSLTFWLAQNGYRYHSDELILLDAETGAIQAFTRPFNIKHYGLDAIRQLVDLDALGDQVLRGNNVHMIAHRAINADYQLHTPNLNRLLFPRYKKDAPNTLTKLSGAAAGLELMKSNVIARNQPGHGFDQLLGLVKSVDSYRLDYNDFKVLPELLAQMQLPADGK